MTETPSGEDNRYAYSRLTDTWYRVDEWEWRNEAKGQMIAKSKTEVNRDDVPQKWISGVQERGDV